MKSILVFMGLLVLAACTSDSFPPATAKPTAAPVSLPTESASVIPSPAQTPLPSATPTPPPRTPTTASSPTPAPTGDAAYDAFGRRLIAAIETDDQAVLRELLAPRFTFGLWNAGPGRSRDLDEALSWYRDIVKQGRLAIDPERAPFSYPRSQELAERTLVAQWLQANGVVEYAELFLKQIAGQWKWTGILLRIPYYLAPTRQAYRTQPHWLFNVTMVGLYRGSDRTTSDTTNSPPPVGAERTFVFRSLTGDQFWVLYTPEAWKVSFDPDDPAGIGQLVRLTSQPIIEPGQALSLGAHEVISAVGSGYQVLSGQIEDIRRGAYVAATLRMGGGSIRTLWLHEPRIYIANGCRETALSRSLQSLTVMAIGLPPTNDIQKAMGWDLSVTEIHVIPETNHRWLLANQSVLFDRARRMYWRDRIQPGEFQGAPDDLSLSSRCDMVPPSTSVR